MRAQLFETLRTVLRSRKITYEELAKKLGVSEPTVKRVFAAKDAKLSRIIEICDVLDIPVEDVFAQAKRTEVKLVVLGDRLEAQLAEDPSLFYFFVLLQDGMSVGEIAKQFGLSHDAMFSLGRRLEHLSLAEVHLNDRIRLINEHSIQYRRDGPLHRMLVSINMNFLREVYAAPETETTGFLTKSRRVSAHTAKHMMRELSELNRDLSEMARQDQLTLPDAELQSFKICMAWAPFNFSRLVKIEG